MPMFPSRVLPLALSWLALAVLVHEAAAQDRPPRGGGSPRREGLSRGEAPGRLRGGGRGFPTAFPLHSAAERGDIQSLERMAGRGMMLETLDDEGRTALHVAALAGQTNTVEWLVANGMRMDIFTAAALGDVAAVEQFLDSPSSSPSPRGPSGITPLHWATKNVATMLIDRGADVNARSLQDLTPLHEAARRNRADVVLLLLEKGGDVNARSQSKATVLNLATENGHFDLAEILLARGALMDEFDAAALGRLEPMEQFLKARPSLLGLPDERSGQTLLHRAALHGRTTVIRRLLDLGANLTTKDRNGFEAIHLAVLRGHREATELLLDAGAGVNTTARTGLTCLHLAVETDHVELVRLLIDRGAKIDGRNGSGMTPLHLASGRPTPEIARVLIEKGADVNARSDFNSVPLHWAAMEGRVEMIPLLLEHGADAYVINDRMQSPLETAMNRRRWHAARVLIRHGVVLRGEDGGMHSPLVLALQHQAPREFVEELLADTTDVNDPDAWGRSPLHQVAHSGQVELLDLLVSKGAMVNLRDHERGNTALHWAAEGGHARMVEALLAKHARVDLRDNDGRTPLHLAAAKGRLDIVRILLSRGAEVNARDSVFAPTPLNLALDGGHDHVADLLRQRGGRESLTVPRMLLWCVLASAILAGAHRVWQMTGRKPALQNQKA